MSQAEPDIPLARPGQTLRPDDINASTAAIANLARTFAENQKQTGQAQQPPRIEHFLGRIRLTPPEGSTATSDFTDCRYFVEYSTPLDSLSLHDKFLDKVETTPNIKRWLVATNLSELPTPPATDNTRPDGSHSLPDGTVVHVFAFPTRNIDGKPSAQQFVFASGGGSFLRAKLTGQTLVGGGATGRGWYSGVLANEPSGVTASLPFTETMFGTAGSTQIYVANHAEIGGTGTALPLPCFCLVLFHRNDINDGTPCYLFVADIPTEPYVCPTGSGSGS